MEIPTPSVDGEVEQPNATGTNCNGAPGSGGLLAVLQTLQPIEEDFAPIADPHPDVG